MSKVIEGDTHPVKNQERMKKRICRAGIPLAVVAMTCCFAVAAGVAAKPVSPAALAPKAPNLDEYDVARSTLGFAVNLYGQIAKEPGNLFFSPYSIASALSTVYGGARGKTADEMSRVLQLNVPAAAAASGFRALRARMKIPKDDETLTTADSLWTEQTFAFRKDFVDASLADYGASAHVVDFRNNSGAVRGEINSWVEQATHDKIKDLIGPGGVGAETRLVVCSAIYFKAGWDKPFDADFTRPEPFYLQVNNPVNVPMMRDLAKHRICRVDGAELLELSYGAQNLSMVVVLPIAKDGLPGIERNLTAATVTGWLEALDVTSEVDVDVSMPSFKITEETDLLEPLRRLGMVAAFDSARADFSGMSARPGLFVSDIVHKAYIDVDEKGTEAAAATAVTFAPTAVYEPPVPVEEFKADHPFLYLIRDSGTDEILFWGRIVDPR